MAAFAAKFTAAALLLMLTALPVEAQPLAPNVASVAPTTPEGIEAAKPNPQAPGFRIPFPPLDQMTPDQQKAFIGTGKTFYTPVGDRAPLLLTPDVEAPLTQVAVALRKNPLPADLFELTIAMVAREWGAQLEWWIHAPVAVKAGLPADAVEAIRLGKIPKFSTPAQEATYQYFKELLRDHNVSDATYKNLQTIVGPVQLVNLTTLAGYYTNVSMMIVAHGVPLRADVKPPLPKLAHNFPAQ